MIESGSSLLLTLLDGSLARLYSMVLRISDVDGLIFREEELHGRC